MSHYYFHFPSVDNIRVSNIGATNLQENKVAQVNDQGARARSRWGSALARNTAGQTASSSQVGRATNNIGISSRARRTRIRVNKVDATNLQSNDVVQASRQRARSRTGGADPALNTLWQSSGNYQNGAATNNINIWA